ncbi:sodium:solute symporter family protein [Clostridium aminobutyricum]|uniref:Sodium:solute symporter family protein n=1 Tax=Clostridium aminobutyricum TaxID=33953 RepID=A0A939D8Q0_CLOAM|nr:sodium:solute symporter family protein [Clostridium aminobutyricum]MBN7773196.1 sodium:solute symporter family protein [Clostridium aminobutyricum]
METGIITVVLLYQILVIVVIGIIVKNKEKKEGSSHSEAGFALAGRNMGAIVLPITMAFTVLGTAHILGVFELTYNMGAIAIWFSLAHTVLLIVACVGTGRWVRRMGITTVPEALTGMYGKGISIAVACIMAGNIWGILTIETQGIGIVISTMTGWDIAKGAVVGGILGVFYVVIAGMKEVGLINVVNAVIKYVALILAVFFVALKLPGQNFDTIKAYYDADPSQNFMLNVFGNADLFITFAVGNIIAVTFCQGINQMLMQVCMAAKDEKTIKNALWIAAPVNGMFGVFAVTLGLTAKALPEYSVVGAKMAVTTMLVDLLPTWLSAALLAAFVAAILSAFSMTCLTPATIFAVDIYKDLFNKNASEKQVSNVIRIGIVVLVAFAIAVAAYLPPILGAINWLFAWLVPVFWIFVLGLFWKRSTKVAGLTLAVSWILNILWSFSPLPKAIGGLIGELPNAYITLLSALLILIVGNLIVKGEPGYFKTIETQN